MQAISPINFLATEKAGHSPPFSKIARKLFQQKNNQRQELALIPI
jgi:hypothetical protein